MPPIIAISNLLDGALPKIDGYHSEQESYLKKSFHYFANILLIFLITKLYLKY